MAITYTESWDQSFSDTLNERQVTIDYHVVDDTNPLTAVSYKSATEATSGASFPIKGQVWASDTRYRLHSLSSPKFKGPRYAVVTGTYKTGPFGGSETEDNPFAVPTRYRWRPVTQSEQRDTDIEGRPLLNSAGDPFSTPVQGYINTYIVEAVRNEAAFNAPLAVQYQNTVNNDSFQLAGSTIQAGEALCTGIFPASAYTLGQEYVEVTYQFEIKERLTLFGGGRVTAHVYRIMDQGRQGFVDAGGALSKVPIYYRNGDGDINNPTLAPTDVPLDRGAPLGEPGAGGTTYWSIDAAFNPPDKGWIDNPQVSAPPLLAIDKDPDPPAGSGITFLFYRKHAEANFGALGL